MEWLKHPQVVGSSFWQLMNIVAIFTFLAVLDSFLAAEMNCRYSDKSTTIMTAVQACIPGSDTFFDLKEIEGFCDFYDIDIAVQSEIEAAREYPKPRGSSSGCFAWKLFPSLNTNVVNHGHYSCVIGYI